MKVKQPNGAVTAAVAVALAYGSFALAGDARAQQSTESRADSAPTSEAARELREAQQEVQEAGRAVSEANAESREAVREGREAGRAAQQAAQSSTSDSAAAQQSGGSAAAQSSGSGDGAMKSTRTASAGGSSTRSTAQGGSTDAPDAVWLFVPVAVSTQTEKQSQDCWVRLYSGEGFDGRYVTITGPAEIPELRSPYGTGLNNWESAVVGRNATVTTYDDDGFEDRSATLRGGQRYADLGDSKLGLFQDIESLRVTCNATGQQGQSAKSGSSASSSGSSSSGGTSR